MICFRFLRLFFPSSITTLITIKFFANLLDGCTYIIAGQNMDFKSSNRIWGADWLRDIWSGMLFGIYHLVLPIFLHHRNLNLSFEFQFIIFSVVLRRTPYCIASIFSKLKWSSHWHALQTLQPECPGRWHSWGN